MDMIGLIDLNNMNVCSIRNLNKEYVGEAEQRLLLLSILGETDS
jgi:hypothetical protein